MTPTEELDIARAMDAVDIRRQQIAKVLGVSLSKVVGWDDYTDDGRAAIVEEMRAIRTSDEAAGMVLVPREATEEMIDVGAQECAADHESYRTMARETWKAMLAAATESDNG
jgi:ParB-like chromosome segregation protein Spo0J